MSKLKKFYALEKRLMLDAAAVAAISDAILHFDAQDVDADGNADPAAVAPPTDDPEANLGAPTTTGSGTQSFNSTDSQFIPNQDAFLAIDISAVSNPNGVLFETGGNGRGVHVGFDANNNFIVRAGDGADHGGNDASLTGAAILRVSEAPIAGKAGTIFVEVSVSSGSVSAWFLEGGAGSGNTSVFLGTASASDGAFEDGEMHGGGSGGLGGTNAGVGGENNVNFNGTISDFRFYTGQPSPIDTDGSTIPVSSSFSTLQDLAGTNDVATPSSGNVVTNANAFSGNGGIDFSVDSTGYTIVDTTELTASAGDRSFALVFETSDTFVNDQIIYSEGGNTNAYGIGIIDADGAGSGTTYHLYVWAYENGGTGTIAIDLGEVEVDSEYALIVNHDDATGTLSGSLNGGTLVSATGLGGIPDHDGPRLGGSVVDLRSPLDFSSSFAQTDDFDGTLAEFYSWTTSLTAQNFTDIENYFAQKWFGTTAGNNAPTGTSTTVTTVEDTNYTVQSSDFGYADADGQALASVKITELANTGTLFLDANNNDVFDAGEAIALDQVIAIADIDAGHLQYQPGTNVAGNAADTFRFDVSDGIDFAAFSRTITVDVTPVDDAPTLGTNINSDVNQSGSVVIGATSPVVTFGTEISSLAPGTSATIDTLVDNADTQHSIIFTTSGSNPVAVPGEVLFETGGSGQGLGLYLTSSNELAVYAGNATSTPILTTGTSLDPNTQYAAVVEFDQTNGELRIHFQQAGDFSWFNFGRTAEADVVFTQTNLAGGNDSGVGQAGGSSWGGFNGTVSGTTDFQGTIDSDWKVYNFPAVAAQVNTNLIANDVDTASSAVIYTITSDVSDGGLFLNGSAISTGDSFTQADLDNLLLTYSHGGGFNTSDSFTFSLSDGNATLTNLTHTIDIAVPNVAPTDLTLSSTSVNENSANGTLVGLITTADQNVGETFTYNLTNSAGGTFQINGDRLEVASSLDFESTTSYSITIEVTDSGGLTYDETFTININDINDAPTLSNNTPITLNEGGSGNIANVNLAYVDQDNTSSQITYTVNSTTNGTVFVDANLNGTFDVGERITNGQSFSQVQIDFGNLYFMHDGSETTSAGFNFTVSDGTTSLAPSVFGLNVTPQNDAPIDILLSSANINADAVSGDVIGTLTGVDPDLPGDVLTLTIQNDPDNKFDLVGSSLVVDGTFNFSSAETHDVTIRVSDGVLSFDKTFTVTLNPVQSGFIPADSPPLPKSSDKIVDSAGTLNSHNFNAVEQVRQETGLENRADHSGQLVKAAISGGNNSVDQAFYGNNLQEIVRQNVTLKLYNTDRGGSQGEGFDIFEDSDQIDAIERVLLSEKDNDSPIIKDDVESSLERILPDNKEADASGATRDFQDQMDAILNQLDTEAEAFLESL